MTAADSTNRTFDARSTLATPAGGAGDGAARASRAALVRSSQFSATLKGLGATSTAVAGSWTPGAGGPAVGGVARSEGGSGPQETLAAAQATREQAQKPRESKGKDSDDSDHAAGSDTDSGAEQTGTTQQAPGTGAAASMPDRPLSIRSLNDLLLTADPAVLELRNGAGLAKPARPVDARDTNREHEIANPGSKGNAVQTQEATGAAQRRSPASVAATPHASTAAASSGESDSSPAPSPGAPPGESSANAAGSGTALPSAKAAPAAAPATSVATTAVGPIAAPPSAAEPAAQSASNNAPAAGVRAIDAMSTPPRALQVRTAAAAAETPDPERFAALVSRGMAAAMAQKADPQTGQREVTLRLQPHSLGELRVQVGMDGQSVTARFEAASAEARDLLDRSMTALRSSLEARGLHVDRLHVQLAAAGPAPSNAGPQPGTDAGEGQAGRGPGNGERLAWNAGEPNGAATGGGWTATDGSGSQDRAGQDAERLAREVGGWLNSPRGVAGVGATPSWGGRGQGGAAAIGMAGTNRSWSTGADVGAESLMIGIDTVA